MVRYGAIAAAGAALLSVLPTATAVAGTSRAGALDRTFGGNGLVRTQFDRGNSRAHSLAIGHRHRIVVAGTAGDRFALARYKPNGRPDHSFSGDGSASTGFPQSDAEGHAVTIGHEGSVVVAGSVCRRHGPCRFGVAKYKSDGRLDRSFGRHGKERIGFESREDSSANAVAIDPKGRVLIGGTSCDQSACDFALVRLRRNGELDHAFGDGGRVLTSFGNEGGDPVSGRASSMAVDPRGRIVLGGSTCVPAQTSEGECFESDWQPALAKYQPNGDPDLSFGEGGQALYRLRSLEVIHAIALYRGGRIVAVGGTSGNGWAVARFGVSGGLDPSFGNDGQVGTGFPGSVGGADANAVAIDSRNRIIVAGRYGFRFALARYRPNGTLNRSFGRNGRVVKDFGSAERSASCKAVAIDSHKRPVVAGFAKRSFAVARLLG